MCSGGTAAMPPPARRAGSSSGAAARRRRRACLSPKPRIEPCHSRRFRCPAPSGAKEVHEHPVMVAVKDDPGGAALGALHQQVDHAPAVRAPVDKVAQVDDRRGASSCLVPVAGDSGMRSLEHGELPVDVADGVDAHGGLRKGRVGSHRPNAPPSGQATSNSRARTCWKRPVSRKASRTGPGTGSST